jgi:hypothetical protein
MTEMDQAAAKARALGLALIDASRVYEDFVIPSFEGHLWQRRPFPHHRRAIIGLGGHGAGGPVRVLPGSFLGQDPGDRDLNLLVGDLAGCPGKLLIEIASLLPD